MQINTPEDLLAAVEAARKDAGLSERELSVQAGKSHSAYWWWKRKVGVTSVETALEYARVLGLQITVSAK